MSWTRKRLAAIRDPYSYGGEPHWKSSHIGRGLSPGECVRIDRLTRPVRRTAFALCAVSLPVLRSPLFDSNLFYMDEERANLRFDAVAGVYPCVTLGLNLE